MPRIRTLEGADWILYISILSSYISFCTCFFYFVICKYTKFYLNIWWVSGTGTVPSFRL